MKLRKAFLIFIMLSMLILLTACGNDESLAASNTGEPVATTESPQLKFADYENATTWNEGYLYYYLESRGMDDMIFGDERQKWAENQKAMGDDYRFIKLDSDITGHTYYELTEEQTKYVYLGKAKDGRPEGFGAIFHVVPYNWDEDMEIIDAYYSKLYVGNFDNGYYDGFGVSYLTFDTTDATDATLLYYLGLPQPAEQEDPQKWVDDYYNEVGYMGYFEKGELDGMGCEFNYPSLMSILPEYSENPDVVDTREIGIAYGTFKKGSKNGHFTVFENGYLRYDGEYKKDEMHGQGTEFFENSNQIKYTGGYSYGEYHGQGTLYNKDGTVFYKGKWAYGERQEA